jgi:hypothetical protein
MPPLFCPRCQRANPEQASFCHFDGAELRSQQDGSYRRLGKEFVFPSGRRCRNFDDFAQSCRDEWPAARTLLRGGQFKQFFGGTGRTDLAKAAQEAAEHKDGDIALTMFLDALPVIQTQAPKIDINPRRLLLGKILAGEQRQLELIVTNRGQGTLQGTLTIKEGSDWLKLDAASSLQCAIAAPREQKIGLKVDTRGLPAGGTFGALLTVITNGGVVEVVARMELVAHPFPKVPFQGAKTPREIAEYMRKFPKAAVPLLENGEVGRWFTGNGWNFPVRGPLAKGVAGVQQFFETMGLSKPPVVQLAPAEVRLGCQYPATVRAQVVMQTQAKKWVFGAIASDSPWLRVLTPQVSGPQQATIAFEVDPKLGAGTPLEGALRITTNGGKELTAKVFADVRGAPRFLPGARSVSAAPIVMGVPVSAQGSWWRPMMTLAIAFFLVRLLLVPLVDLGGQAALATAAATKAGVATAVDSPLSATGGWLQLPWSQILTGSASHLSVQVFDPSRKSESISASDFRYYFAIYLLRRLVLWTWWLGAVLGGFLVVRSGSDWAQLPWGVIAGAAAGAAGSVTLGSLFLIVEIVPHALAGMILSGHETGPGLLLFWEILALFCWTVCGALVGLCWFCGLRGLKMALGRR